MGKKPQPALFTYIRAAKTMNVANSYRKSYAVAQKGDWIILDAHLQAAVISDESFQKLLAIQPKSSRKKSR